MRVSLTRGITGETQSFRTDEVLHGRNHSFWPLRTIEHDMRSHPLSHTCTSAEGLIAVARRRARRAADWARNCRSWRSQIVEDQRRGYQRMRWSAFQHQAQCDLRMSAGQRYQVKNVR